MEYIPRNDGITSFNVLLNSLCLYFLRSLHFEPWCSSRVLACNFFSLVFFTDFGIRKSQFGSVAQSCLTLFTTLWSTACQASLYITNSWRLLKLMSIESGMPSNHLILCRPHLLLPSIFPSFRVFSNASVLHIRWPKYWSFSFSISPLSEFIVTHWIPSNEYSGLISFRIDWFDLLAVQGTLKSLLQHHSSGKCWPPKMSLDSFPLLQFFGWIWERLILLPLWYSSPVKPSDPELFFVGRFWL